MFIFKDPAVFWLLLLLPLLQPDRINNVAMDKQAKNFTGPLIIAKLPDVPHITCQ